MGRGTWSAQRIIWPFKTSSLCRFRIWILVRKLQFSLCYGFWSNREGFSVSWDLMVQLKEERCWAFGFPLGCYGMSRAGGDGSAKMKILSKGGFVNFCRYEVFVCHLRGCIRWRLKKPKKTPKIQNGAWPHLPFPAGFAITHTYPWVPAGPPDYRALLRHFYPPFIF